MDSFSLKKDSYSRARGNYSRLMNLHCRKCKNFILLYQKDGSGNLRRLYFDRILFPAKIKNSSTKRINQAKNLRCDKCSELLGVPHLYEKENRKSFKIFQDAIVKRIRKL